ncbi:hypothetical protein BpHYR1_001898 [Brachionus plicatilis]|uniref:Uncharacterized protein n=1 Tax=Brachionus plicatilis TaxID=10195 RepID=A0A3M7SJV9_BRAPC|nr:hypothetical protein BpHYR1_001898 [Brachionus plicatilis]
MSKQKISKIKNIERLFQIIHISKMNSSPFINRLRSNPNYKLSDPIPTKNRIDKKATPVVNAYEEDENYLANISIEDELTQEKFDSNVIESLTDVFNKLATKEDEIDTWELQKSQKGGYKLYSLGYGNLVERPSLKEIETATTVYWKCDK